MKNAFYAPHISPSHPIHCGERRVTSARFQDRVSWFGAMEPEELPALFAASDINVWPVIRETLENKTFELSVLEAQAAGLPVVAGDGQAVTAITRPLETALLPAQGDATAFARAIADLLDHPAQRKAMGEAGKRHAWASHDRQKAALRLDDLIKTLCGNRGPCP